MTAPVSSSKSSFGKAEVSKAEGQESHQISIDWEVVVNFLTVIGQWSWKEGPEGRPIARLDIKELEKKKVYQLGNLLKKIAVNPDQENTKLTERKELKLISGCVQFSDLQSLEILKQAYAIFINSENFHRWKREEGRIYAECSFSSDNKISESHMKVLVEALKFLGIRASLEKAQSQAPTLPQVTILKDDVHIFNALEKIFKQDPKEDEIEYRRRKSDTLHYLALLSALPPP